MDLLEHKNSESLRRHPWELARFEVLTHLLKNSQITLNNNIIADIGCGDTFILNSLSELFPNNQYYGIDNAFSPEIINSFKKESTNSNINLYNNLSNIDSAKNVNLVLLMDVVEHIEDDLGFLKHLNKSSLVNKETNFLITVPAYNSLFTSHDTYLKHYRRYNSKELVSLVTKAGFEVKDSGYFFFSLLFIRILQKVKEGIFGTKPQKGLNNNSFSNYMTNFIKLVLLLDFRIARIFKSFSIKIPGLSTYIVCKTSVQ